MVEFFKNFSENSGHPHGEGKFLKNFSRFMPLDACSRFQLPFLGLILNDIDSQRQTLHIRCGKNRKDRLAILSPVVLGYLRTYWKHCRFTDYIFPGGGCDHITTGTAAKIYQKAKERAEVKKPGGIHSLRHGFATHALESGVDLFVIKQLLGHSSIHSTVRYLSFVPCKDKNVKSPIDQLSI